jgi:hypothetical protein
MVEVIGGRFWRPYSREVEAILNAQSDATKSGAKGDATPVGMNPNLYQQRPPLDLSEPRLRILAAALGPAYVRVSGTWANMVYFHDEESPPPSAPPPGFGGVLTREQWRGVIDFVQAVDGKLVTSFATGPGTRNEEGVWTTDQARRLLEYTRAIGGTIAAAEFMNEPTAAEMGGAPKGYNAAQFARDVALFDEFVRQNAPEMLHIGPGSVGEGLATDAFSKQVPFIHTEEMLQATGPVFDRFSYHFYGAVSKRCAGMMPQMATAEEHALSEEWFERTELVAAFYAALRDTYLPGRELWLTETADAACGGNPWAQTFLDSFRYIEQLARLARRGVQTVMHNTFAASDYGLVDETTLTPRPNYWVSLLWRKLMGRVVLDAGASPANGLQIYAHSLRENAGREHTGGVALLVVNSDQTTPQTLQIPLDAERYTLTAQALAARTVQLNGRTLQLSDAGELPVLQGEKRAAGEHEFPPASITFLALPGAKNASSH